MYGTKSRDSQEHPRFLNRGTGRRGKVYIDGRLW